MKPHDPFLELAAIGIDFPLASADRGRLEQHLASCPACARSAHAFRADALALSDLPRVTLPERRGSAILGAALQPHAVRHPLRLVLLAALLGLLLVGSLAVGAQLLRNPEDELSVVLPVPSQSAPADAMPVPSAIPTASPAVGPSGVLAVTHADETGGTWVELVQLDTGAVSPLGLGRDPAWFDDGRLVYACAKAQGENTTICVVDLADEVQPEIASDATQPAPAPDGSLITVHRGMIDVGETWIMADDGSNLRLLHSGAFLRWSPDGAWLAGQPESATNQVAIVGADGEGFQVLADGYDPAWAPPGNRIAYGLVDDQGASLRTVHVATGEIEILHVAPAGESLAAPAWLPDGRVLFVQGGDIWLFDPGQTAPARLTTGLKIAADGVGDPLAVSPDGGWVAFTTGNGADARVGIASVNGGWEMLNLEPGPLTQPRWMPEPAPAPDDPLPSVTAKPRTPGTAAGPWTEAIVPFGAGRIEAVTAGGPGFVAVGRGCYGIDAACEGVIWTSTDGRTWQGVPASDPIDTGAYFSTSGPEIGMFDVTADAPRIVAIGYAARPKMSATIWLSEDEGASWERAMIGDAGTTRVNAVTWDGRSFVMVGEDRSEWDGTLEGMATAAARAAVWTSTDGYNFDRVPHAKVFDVGGFIDTMEDPSTGGMSDVVAGPGGLVAVGSVCTAEPIDCQPAAWTSPDGISWERATGMPVLSGVLRGVAASESRFVAVGPELVLTSPDGRSWTQQPLDQPLDLVEVSRIGEEFLATADGNENAAWTSDDGSAWAPLDITAGPASGGPSGVTQWHFATSRDIAVGIGESSQTNEPVAWVVGGGAAP